MTRWLWFVGALMGAVFLWDPAQAQVAVQQSGPAVPNDGACFVQNGIIQDCGFRPSPGGAGSCMYRPVTAGSTDIATSNDCTIAWTSSATSAKTEFLYACVSSTMGYKLTVADGAATASAYQILLTANGSDTIAWSGVTASVRYIVFNGQSIDMQCNGAGTWLVQ